MIPRRFFWLFDFLVLGVAFVAAYLLVPSVGPFLNSEGPLPKSWFILLDLPSRWNGQLPPASESLWILLVMSIAAIVVLGLLGSHGSLFDQSFSRIILVGLVATLAGQSLITLV